MSRVLMIKNDEKGVHVSAVFTMSKVVRFKEPIRLEVLRGFTKADEDALKGEVDFCTLDLASEVLRSVVDVKKVKEEWVRVKRLLEDLESEAVTLDSSIEETLINDQMEGEGYEVLQSRG